MKVDAMIDEQSTERDLSTELGFRVVRQRDGDGEPHFQFQKLDSHGNTLSCQPAQPHAYVLWVKAIAALRALGVALDDGGEASKREDSKRT
jgi:hypothetical protein